LRIYYDESYPKDFPAVNVILEDDLPSRGSYAILKIVAVQPETKSSCSGNTCTLYEGESVTANVGGGNYVVKINFLSYSSVKLEVSKTITYSLSVGGTFKLKNGYLKVKNIFFSDYVGGGRYVIFELIEPTCTDSDGGLDYYTKGYVTNNIDYSLGDECFASNSLREYFCEGGSYTSINYNCFDNEICSDGACVYVEKLPPLPPVSADTSRVTCTLDVNSNIVSCSIEGEKNFTIDWGYNRPIYNVKKVFIRYKNDMWEYNDSITSNLSYVPLISIEGDDLGNILQFYFSPFWGRIHDNSRSIIEWAYLGTSLRISNIEGYDINKIPKAGDYTTKGIKIIEPFMNSLQNKIIFELSPSFEREIVSCDEIMTKSYSSEGASKCKDNNVVADVIYQNKRALDCIMYECLGEEICVNGTSFCVLDIGCDAVKESPYKVYNYKCKDNNIVSDLSLEDHKMAFDCFVKECSEKEPCISGSVCCASEPEKIFPIGVFEVDAIPSEEQVQKMKELNINTILAGRWFLGLAEEYDLKVILPNVLGWGVPNTNTITDAINHYCSSDSLIRYYLEDEPGGSDQYHIDKKNFNKGAQSILEKYDPKHPGITTYSNYPEPVSQTVEELKPHELMMDLYPMGNREYSDNELRQRLDSFADELKFGKETAEKHNIDFWFVPQVHGIKDESGNILLRQPSTQEEMEMVNLAISYGAKGIMYFLYNSLITDGTGSSTARKWEIYEGLVDLEGKPNSLYYGVQEINSKLQKLSPVLIDLKWTGTINSKNINSDAGNFIGNLDIKSISGDVEVGTFENMDNPNKKYIFLVNRDLKNSQTINVEFTIPVFSLYDVFTEEETLSIKDKELGTFSINLEKADGKLFEIRNLSFLGRILRWIGID